MIGRVFVNEIAPQAVALDFSSWPGDILKPEAAYGFAYLKTLDMLGVRTQIVNDAGNRTALLAGEITAVQRNLPKLRGHIGLIARYGALLDYPYAQSYTRDDIGRSIGNLASELAAMPPDTDFATVATAITRPFADAANDPKESFRIISREMPWWLSETALLEREAQIAAFVAPIAPEQDT